MTNFLNKRSHKTLHLKHINQAMTANLKRTTSCWRPDSLFLSFFTGEEDSSFYIILLVRTENTSDINSTHSSISWFHFICHIHLFSHSGSVLLVLNRLFCILNINQDWIRAPTRVVVQFCMVNILECPYLYVFRISSTCLLMFS